MDSATRARRVLTRAELMAAYGLGRSTLEKWYRERRHNGHPEAVPAEGLELVWDADEWAAWFTSRQTAGGVPRGLVNRDGLAAAHGLSRHALKKLWAERADNGHPEAAHQAGKALYWDAADWAAWYERHLTRERSGPRGAGHRDLVTLAEVGRILGLAPSSVTVYVNRPPAGWPEPARVEPLAGGRVRRLYRRSDITAYARTRRSPGGVPAAGEREENTPG